MGIRVNVVRLSGRKYLYMQYRDAATGKEERRSTRKTLKKDADKVAAVWEAELNAGTFAAPDKVAWRIFRDRFEAEHLTGLDPDTASKSGTVLDRLEEFATPALLRDITSDVLSRHVAHLRAGGRQESTIAGHLAYLRSAFQWAVDRELLRALPKFPKTRRAKRKKMKGRPITEAEFRKMLRAVPAIVGPERTADWRHYLEGIWWSGLRLEESLELHWDSDEHLSLDFTSGKHPMLWIPSEHEKGNKDRLMPIVPEFARFLNRTPEDERNGHVFRLNNKRTGNRLGKFRVSEFGVLIGAESGVRVRSTGKNGFVSIHDLRRSFGLRLAHSGLNSFRLKGLMRHESIKTTEDYYFGVDAQETAEFLWSQMGDTDDLGDTFGDIDDDDETEDDASDD